MARQLIDSPPTQEQRIPMSYEEFLAFGEDTTHAEWADGEVIVFMPPKPPHQQVVVFLVNLLSLYVRLFKLGEVLVAPLEMRLVPGRLSREPDVLFIAREHLDRLTPDRLEGPADLVVEFISDDSVRRDREEKFRDYQAAGIPEYWVADPRLGRRHVDFFVLTPQGSYREVIPDADGRYHSAVIPGFWLDPNWLWQDPLPDPLTLIARIAPKALRDLLGTIEPEPGSDETDS